MPGQEGTARCHSLTSDAGTGGENTVPLPEFLETGQTRGGGVVSSPSSGEIRLNTGSAGLSLRHFPSAGGRRGA